MRRKTVFCFFFCFVLLHSSFARGNDQPGDLIKEGFGRIISAISSVPPEAVKETIKTILKPWCNVRQIAKTVFGKGLDPKESEEYYSVFEEYFILKIMAAMNGYGITALQLTKISDNKDGTFMVGFKAIGRRELILDFLVESDYGKLMVTGLTVDGINYKLELMNDFQRVLKGAPEAIDRNSGKKYRSARRLIDDIKQRIVMLQDPNFGKIGRGEN